MGGINKNKRAKTIASDKLKRWSIPQSLINTMHEDGYLDEAKWEYLRNEALYAENLERRVKEEARRQKEEDKREYDEKYGDQGHKWNLGFKSKAREIDIHRSLSTNYVQSKANDEYPYFNTTLHRIGFEYVHIESFLDGMEKQEEANRPAESILREWKIPNPVIEEMRKARVLAQKHWDELTDQQLEEFGLNDKQTFTAGLAKFKRSKSRKTTEYLEATIQAEEEIRAWGIPPVLVDHMKEEGWIHPEYWDDLLEHEYELQELGFKNGHISTFRRKFQEWKETKD
eukprot:722822_1